MQNCQRLVPVRMWTDAAIACRFSIRCYRIPSVRRRPVFRIPHSTSMPRSEHLSDFELYVMLAVAALDDEAYGVSIATRINDRTGRDVSIGAVYATLGRLADKAFVSFRVSDPEPVRGGCARAAHIAHARPDACTASARLTSSRACSRDATPPDDRSSSVSAPRPPSSSRALIAAATEPSERQWLLADLDELYADKRAAGAPGALDCGTGGRSFAPSLRCSAAVFADAIRIPHSASLPMLLPAPPSPTAAERARAAAYFFHARVPPAGPRSLHRRGRGLTLALGVGAMCRLCGRRGVCSSSARYNTDADHS